MVCRLTDMSQERSDYIKKDVWGGDDFETGQMLLFGLTAYDFYGDTNCYTETEALKMIDRANAYSGYCCNPDVECTASLNAALSTESLAYLLTENGYRIYI